MNYVFSKGQIASFRFGMYFTDNPDFQAQLDNEVAQGHPQIYIDPNMPYVTLELEDPARAYRERIIADYLAAQAKHIDPSNDMGNSVQGPINTANSSTIASTAAGGDASQSAAKLVSLAKSMAAQATAKPE
jgi:hypothetical protein